MIDWAIVRHRGSAGAFHALEMAEPTVRELWWFEVDRPAVVLGSTQRNDVVSAAAAEEAGMEVARRRSGGGAVLLVPGEVTWVDVLLPVTDSRWRADVGESFDWLGQAWAAVLRGFGAPEPVVHRGPLLRTEWSDLVCFAGLGPGEVTIDGRKVVGISQRRTRHGARFQCAFLHRWNPELLVRVLDLAPDRREAALAALDGVAAGFAAVEPAVLVQRLQRQLTS